MKQIISLCLMLLFFGCNKSEETPTGPPVIIDLLSNPTFESNGNPSLAGWIVPDTSTVHFTNDMPPGGKGYSIIVKSQISVLWPGASVFVNIVPAPGKHRYRLSCYTKSKGTAGYCAVYLKRGNMTVMCGQFYIPATDTIWTNTMHDDTLTTVYEDTLIVNLNGGMLAYFPGTTYFNSCQFQKIY